MTRVAAVISGAILFTLPFQLYLFAGSHHGDRTQPHTDHDPHHGGTVVMVDDHHLEIVETDGRVEVYVTDALRRPVQPTDGDVSFDDGATAALVWNAYRLVAQTPRTFTWGDYGVRLKDGTVLAIRVPAGPSGGVAPKLLKNRG
jgi:hypothetical protein